MASDAINTPWKIGLEARRVLTAPYARLYFAMSGVVLGPGAKIYGCPIIQRHRKSRIEIGSRFSLRSWGTSNPLGPYRPAILSTRSAGARLRIGSDVGMTGGTVCATESIEIGDRVFIGANAIIVDTDFHPTLPEERKLQPNAGAHAPVVIEDDAFIGMNSIVLRGVRIGTGAFIGAGSVVTSDVPARTICAGNPAKVIRDL